jgi:hypothetical protein
MMQLIKLVWNGDLGLTGVSGTTARRVVDLRPSSNYNSIKKRNDLVLLFCASSEELIFKKLVRSGKSSIRQRACDQPGPFSIIRLEVTAV